jgi:integrase
MPKALAFSRTSTNLYLRGGTYYVRVAVPIDLQAGLGRREVWKSLGTKDRRAAARLLHHAMGEIHAMFAAARAAPAAADGKRHALRGEFDRALRRFYADVDAAAAEARAGWSGDPDGRALLSVLSGSRTAHLGALEAAAGTGDLRHAEPVARELADREGWKIEEGTPEWAELCQRTLRVMVELQRRETERDRGRFDGKPSDPVLTAPLPSAPANANAGAPLVQLHAAYLDEQPHMSAEWKGTCRAIFRLFADHVGHHRDVATITRRDVREFKGKLLKFPSRGTLSAGKDATLDDIMRKDEKDKRPPISARTVNKYLSAVSAFFDWAKASDMVEDNPADGMLLPKSETRSTRDPFTVEQLRRLFGSPLYTGAAGTDGPAVAEPGPLRIRDWRYWLPLVSLYSGARMSEIAQLTTEDVMERQGVTLLSITNAAGKTIKSKSAKRIVPVHPELEALGFLRMVAERSEAGGGRLFPEIEPDSLDRLSTDASKFFTAYLRRIGVKVDGRLTFHSFRHTFADALRIAGYPDAVTALLVGHAAQTTTAGYGKEVQFGPADRLKIIKDVTYPGLDLSHLKD